MMISFHEYFAAKDESLVSKQGITANGVYYELLQDESSKGQKSHDIGQISDQNLVQEEIPVKRQMSENVESEKRYSEPIINKKSYKEE
jgi:hypothetical protein|tara:strand:- start:491 stop:754 length:264 start_codon:yes stop_codon:yes gene_type:complete